MSRMLIRCLPLICFLGVATTLRGDTFLGSDKITLGSFGLAGSNLPVLTSVQVWFQACHSQLQGELSCDGPPLGTDLNISPSTVAQKFILNSSNDPNFGVTVAGVESGGNPLAQIFVELGNAGEGVAGLDSFSLPGATVDSFVYIVSPFQIVTTSNSIQIPSFTVEVDAYGEPAASSVSEPSTLSLLGVALGVSAMRKRTTFAVFKKLASCNARA